MPYTPKQTDYTGQISFLASEKMVVKKGGVTINSTTVSAGADGRKVLKAGSIVARTVADNKFQMHTDDLQTANTISVASGDIGILLQDVDVTDGDEIGGIMFAGSVVTARLPVAPTANAKAALPLIIWQ